MSNRKKKHNNPQGNADQKAVQTQQANPEENIIKEQDTNPAEETAKVQDTEPAEESAKVQDIEPAEESAKVQDIEPAEEPAEVQDIEPAEKTPEVQDIEPAEETPEVQDIEPAEETPEVQDIESAEESAEVQDTEAQDSEPTAQTTEEQAAVPAAKAAEHGTYDWMEEIREELQSLADKIERVAAGQSFEEAFMEDSAEASGEAGAEQAAPARSKEDIQKELAEIKAQFTHTPMEMTPELEKLLHLDIKAKGKKDKKRGAQMLSVLAKHNFYANGITPVELRTTLEDLGPTYVKIGQIMSSRLDLLPANYCQELEKLRQSVKELDPAVARAIIEVETGKKIDEIYSEFRDEPIGSASIGQVHYGVLLDGRKVVTKVQRPLIAEIMEKDIELLKKLAPLVGGGSSSGKNSDAMDLVTILNELEKVTKEELDFRIEAANTRFFRDVILADGNVSCPEVIDELTTERIFTMTYVDGCSIGETEELVKQGLDPEEAGKDIVDSYLHQVFDVGIFHADPHQGNIMASEGKVYWIDFGMIGQITETDMNSIQDLVVGLLSNDSESMVNAVMTIGISKGQTDRNKLKDDLEAFSTKYMNVTSLNDIDFSAVLTEVCELAERHQIEMPGRYTMLARSFLTIEGVMEHLCPGLNLFELVSNKLVERVKRSFVLEKEIVALGRGVLDAGKKASRLPKLAADALNDIMKGRMKINLELTGYDDLLDALNEKINDVILIIVGCVLFSGGCRLCQTDIKPVTPNGMPLFAVIILILGISLILYALRRIFTYKK